MKGELVGEKTLDNSLRMAHETLEVSRAIERKLYEQGKTLRQVDKDCNEINEHNDKSSKTINKMKSFFNFNFFKKKKKEKKPEALDLYEATPSISMPRQSNMQEEKKQVTYNDQLEDLHDIIKELRDVQRNIGYTVDSHNRALDQIEGKVDVNVVKMKKNTKGLKKLIE